MESGGGGGGSVLGIECEEGDWEAPHSKLPLLAILQIQGNELFMQSST